VFLVGTKWIVYFSKLDIQQKGLGTVLECPVSALLIGQSQSKLTILPLPENTWGWVCMVSRKDHESPSYTPTTLSP
jgi:hypothetical protein